jgi:hypothetical protein
VEKNASEPDFMHFYSMSFPARCLLFVVELGTILFMSPRSSLRLQGALSDNFVLKAPQARLTIARHAAKQVPGNRDKEPKSRKGRLNRSESLPKLTILNEFLTFLNLERKREIPTD